MQSLFEYAFGFGEWFDKLINSLLCWFSSAYCWFFTVMTDWIYSSVAYVMPTEPGWYSVDISTFIPYFQACNAWVPLTEGMLAIAFWASVKIPFSSLKYVVAFFVAK
ncbi:hypothetical protein Pan241w_22270 [Gimesia alba]|uniref:Uncharacterized protein n=1 Tax=Gimesia alba TaxID=2527973 RepID=A0A517RE61_9PLAN|nr:hypothetical protein [Gimesia alba]QDT42146.1 hypothetical protein Pan241w_22270 [Gimesia alba]